MYMYIYILIITIPLLYFRGCSKYGKCSWKIQKRLSNMIQYGHCQNVALAVISYRDKSRINDYNNERERCKYIREKVHKSIFG